MESNILKEFIATDVPLSSSNLIEASAGTGKTYSIAILVLRLILEEKFSIKEILMVTFTKAAVAELEERIRLFIRLAYKAANNEVIEDPTIKLLVANAISKYNEDEIKDLLKEAKLLLDETSVMTIHSFCQQSLNEFAFETNQLFGSETMQDTSSLILDEVNKFWREQITVLDPLLLKFLLPNGLNREILEEIVSKSLNGQQFIDYNPQTFYSFPVDEQREVLEEILLIERERSTFMEDLFQEVLESTDKLTECCESNSFAKKNVLPLILQPQVFINYLKENTEKSYINKVFSYWLEKLLVINTLQSEIDTKVRSVLSKLYYISIQASAKNITYYKEKNSVLSFNDMIVQLHKALTKPNSEKLIIALRKKYKAVFIDEFQDTDKLQYEIFKSAFGKDTILFYIGDPKQSIYAWRQADLNTYFEAADEVANKYGMNQNYRSSENFIKAMNIFFLPTNNFDTFYFGLADESIKYNTVNSPIPNKKGILLNAGKEEIPITIFENQKSEELYQTVCAQIIQLLEKGDFLIDKDGKKRTIKPSDIGILVRKKSEGRNIKAQLAKYGIPAITIDDSKVLQTSEARSLFYLLNAFFESNPSNVNKALLSPLTGFSRLEILKLNHDKELENFKRYGLLWQRSGVYATLMKFLIDYDIKGNLLNNFSGNGERSITNLFQLIEILHKIQSSKNFSQIELINWLKRGLEGMKTDGDEYEQRVESDMDAIEIVTIHKSKGLEYNIVFAPFLDLKADNNHVFSSFKEKKTGEYLFGITENLEDNQSKMMKEQLEQENRRLLYVAITRAVYKCYISRFTYYKNNTSLIPFVRAIQTNPDSCEFIQFSDTLEIEKNYRYSKLRNQIDSTPSLAVNFDLSEENWRKLSYSFLAKKPDYIPKPNSHTDLIDYEYFIFKQLLKGNITGNLLHHIFEKIDFTNELYWEKQIQAALIRFMPKQLESYRVPLIQLLKEVLNAKIKIGKKEFKLSEITTNKRLNELEFDFNVPAFEIETLNSLSIINNQVYNYNGKLEGIMNGKIDLLFEHDGLYYILDWKSNFLGDALDNYAKDNLNTAMNNNNYHLQYFIYTIAAKKYLQRRLSNFNYEQQFGGVIYIFIRGLRENNDNGIFVSKPDLKLIEELENILSYSLS